jgi:hypothetical protein
LTVKKNTVSDRREATLFHIYTPSPHASTKQAEFAPTDPSSSSNANFLFFKAHICKHEVFFQSKNYKRGCGIHEKEKEKEEAVFKAGRKGRRSQRKELWVTYGAG